MSTLCLQVPKGMHPSIIGRSGANVRRIQDELKVSITIPRREDPSCEVIVSGPSADIVAKARAEIETAVGFKVFEEPLHTILLDVPAQRQGAIVGKGGAVINGLQKEFNCDVETPRGPEDKYVTICGPRAGASACRKRIEDLVMGDLKVVSDTTGGAAPGVEAAFKKLDLGGDINEALFFSNITKETNTASFERFIGYLQSASSTLDVCVFTLTDDRIVRILQTHVAHGIKVRVITDNDTSAAQGSDIARLKSMGIAVRMDSTAAHMHHKFAVVDGKVLVSGSFNWTRGAADANHENIIVTNNAKLVRSFATEFERIWASFA